MTHTSPSYDSLAEELGDAGVVPSLPELHGGICGVMCAGGVAAAERWLAECLRDWQPQGTHDVGDTLRGLELHTWRMLSATDMSFEPLLPDDDRPLEEQVQGLASWCHGFLTGLGFGGLGMPAGQADAPATLAEITKDFAEISRAGLDAEEARDPRQAGFALAELKEYVRVSVQLVFEQLAGGQLDAPSDSIH